MGATIRRNAVKGLHFICELRNQGHEKPTLIAITLDSRLARE